MVNTMPRTHLATLSLATTLLFGAVACGPDENNDTTTQDNNGGNVDTAAQRQAWETCVAETDTYTPFETSISTAARVAGFETIADKTWRNAMPTTMDFEQANLTYVEEEGLDSRLSRREDEHYPAVMVDGEAVACNSAEDIPENNPDRCVGPAQIRPLVLDALTTGAMSDDLAERQVAGKQLEASLLWFLYTSTYKEATTCTQKKKDCDSSYAYYTGDQPEDMGLGLSNYFRTEVPEAHAAVWDGLVEVRCWREVDDTEEAQNLELRDEALATLDKALLYGISRLVSARLYNLSATDVTAQDRAEDWEWLTIMGPVLEREANTIDAAKAKTLEDAFDKASPDGVDTQALAMTIEELFPSPK